MRRSPQQSHDQRLTVFVPEGAVHGRVIRYAETEVEAVMDRAVPRNERLQFTLHLPGGVLAGEMTCVAGEDRQFRMQFAALTAADRARLAPMLEADE